MKIVKAVTRLAAAAALLLLLLPGAALATHLSGGENDLMGLYGGIALVLGFGGLLGLLGLVPKRWRRFGRRFGTWFLAAGLTVLLAGGYQVSVKGRVEETLGGDAFGRMAAQQIIGVLAVFVGFWGAVYFLAKRSGVLNMGESVKYALLHNGDPADRTATRVALPGEQRLMWIPFVAMGVLALFFMAGILIVLYRLSVAKA